MANNYVRDALSAYRVFGSFTPAAFSAKWPHRPHVDGERIAIVLDDILRVTTTLIAMLACGCRGIYLAVKTPGCSYDISPPVLPHDPWVIGGEEDGRPIPGGTIDNSPLSVLGADLAGKLVKFFSTNGARALQAVLQEGDTDIYLMCVANVAATIANLARGGYTSVWFVNGGFYGASCTEDVVAAGRAIEHLVEGHGFLASALDDEAQTMHHEALRLPTNDALLAALEGRQVPRLLAGLHKTGDVACAVTGAGMGEVWEHMARTVVKVTYIEGVPLLMPYR